MPFTIGEKVKVRIPGGKYAGQSVRIIAVDHRYNPTLYVCETLDSNPIVQFENELESLYEHDMRLRDELVKINKECKEK